MKLISIILLIRVLCIGNSFSWDAVEQELVPLCAAAGMEVEVHNLYYGGCSLEQHAQFLLKDTAAYSHRVCSSAQALMQAFLHSSSVASSLPQRKFSRMVPLKRVLFCKTIATEFLKAAMS